MPSFASLKSAIKDKTPSLPSTPTLPSLPSPSLPKLYSPPLPSFSPSIPSLPSFPSPPSLSSLSLGPLSPPTPQILKDLANRANVLRNKVTFGDDDDEDDGAKEDSQKSDSSTPKDTKPAKRLQPVYIVLRPLKLKEAPQTYLKRLGDLVNAIEFENYLVLQHWGVLVGEGEEGRYYHLHTDKANVISVSMEPFRDELNQRHTIKIPIWRTALEHDDRVGIAVGIIKAMGRFPAESDVDIMDEKGALITSPDDRHRYRMEGRYHRPPWDQLTIFKGKGKYSAVTNNCIHFTKHYVFDQLLSRRKELKNFTENIPWLVKKWGDMGCRRGPVELTKFLASLLGVVNPFEINPMMTVKLFTKILAEFLNVNYMPEMDQKLIKDVPATGEAEEDILTELGSKDDKPAEEVYDATKAAEDKPIPEVVEEENGPVEEDVKGK